jgi:hypothetical protein
MEEAMQRHQFLKSPLACALSFAVLLALVAPLMSPVSAQVIVRGRLERVGSDGAKYPAPYLAVSVSNQQFRSARAYSGSDGMFFLYNVPPGSYQLQVSMPKHQLIYSITVSSQQYFDIAPIRIFY